MHPDWFFPGSEGGVEQGLNDAGIHTFKGNIQRYLAREVIQNSMDAKAGKQPVICAFDLLDFSSDEVPGRDTLLGVFTRCETSWPHEKTINFCRSAARALGARKSRS